MELIKNRTSNKWLSNNNVKNLNVMKIWKIHNKKHKHLFDSLYDYLLESCSKWGDEKKYYEFLFLLSEQKDYDVIVKNLFTCMENQEVSKNILFFFKEAILTNQLDKIEYNKSINNYVNKSNSFFTICKVINLEHVFVNVEEKMTNSTTLYKIINVLIKESGKEGFDEKVRK